MGRLGEGGRSPYVLLTGIASKLSSTGGLVVNKCLKQPLPALYIHELHVTEHSNAQS